MLTFLPGRFPGSNYKIDLDSSVEIIKSNVAAVENNPVGYVGGAITSAGVTLKPGEPRTDYLFYAGDNRNTGSEASYLDVPTLNKVLDTYPTSSNQIEIGMSAWWDSNDSFVDDAYIVVSLYKGGEMVSDPVNYTYKNEIKGVRQSPILSFSSASKRINQRSDNTANLKNYRTRYTPMFKLEYDRVDNSGVLIPWINWE